jgi:ABC-type polysaccharide/polyol phosphate export permease
MTLINMIVSQYINSTLNQPIDWLNNNNNLIYQLDSNPLIIIFSPIKRLVMYFCSTCSIYCSVETVCCLAGVVLAPTIAFYYSFFSASDEFCASHA